LVKPKKEEGNPPTNLIDGKGNLTKVFESIVEDIFKKFDLHIGRELSLDEFRELYNRVFSDKNEPLTSNMFKK